MNPDPVPPPVSGQIKPGEVRNPNGAPKGKRLTTYLKEVLDGEVTLKDLESGQLRQFSKRELVAIALAKEAIQGNIKAIREVFEREDGKIVQKLASTDSEGNDLPDEPMILAPVRVMRQAGTGQPPAEPPPLTNHVAF